MRPDTAAAVQPLVQRLSGNPDWRGKVVTRSDEKNCDLFEAARSRRA